MMLKKTLVAAVAAVATTLAAGFDLTCKLAQSALQDGKLLEAPMWVTYMSDGIGAMT